MEWNLFLKSNDTSPPKHWQTNEFHQNEGCIFRIRDGRIAELLAVGENALGIDEAGILVLIGLL